VKITPEDYEFLRSRIAPLDTMDRRMTYAGLSAKRYRWDLLWASKIKVGDGVGTHGDINLYAYLDDTHIDTALRKIVEAQDA
jgi:hypothetical protein